MTAPTVCLRPGERLGRIDWTSRYDRPQSGCWWFAVAPGVACLEAAAREAVATHLKANPNHEAYAINWGDAWGCVADEVWAAHGLRPLDMYVDDDRLRATVDYDEELNEDYDGN